jgi:hypothetical protein
VIHLFVVAEAFDVHHGIVNVVGLVVARLTIGAAINNHVGHEKAPSDPLSRLVSG